MWPIPVNHPPGLIYSAHVSLALSLFRSLAFSRSSSMTISANVLSLGVYAYRTALLFGRPTHVSTARTDAAKGANEAV